MPDPEWIFLLTPVFGVGLTVAVARLLGILAGWPRLAERFPLRTEFPPPRTRLGYGVFRGWIGYNGGLIVGSDASGLYVKAWPIIAWGTPPFHLPWTELRVERVRSMLSDRRKILIRSAPDADFALRESTWVRVADDARRAGVPGA